MSRKLNEDYVKEMLAKQGFQLLSKYFNARSKIIIKDKYGYKYETNFDRISSGSLPDAFNKNNGFTIHNIKLWLKINKKKFILISKEYNGSGEKLIWKCVEKNCKQKFELSWNQVIRGFGCPYCSSHKTCLANCLATKNPELAKEWHPTMNGDLTPYDVLPNSNKYIWWQCRKNSNHVWKAKLNNRNIKGDSCPYCSGRLATKEYNLLVMNPEVCKEWDYTKNKKKPEEYLPNSNKKVWWRCKECGYEWKASICTRNNGLGCPICNHSKGEKKIAMYLNMMNIDFISQKEFDGLVGLNNKNLSYDFYLPQYNLLIEYQGEQHEKPIDFTGKGMKYAKKRFQIQQEHDRRKREYANNHNIQLLEIWYYDFNKIEEILKLNINKLSKIIE